MGCSGESHEWLHSKIKSTSSEMSILFLRLNFGNSSKYFENNSYNGIKD